MSPQQTAKHNLTDYECRIVSRVITPMEASPACKAGTQLWRAEIWHQEGTEEIERCLWSRKLSEVLAETEPLILAIEARLEKEAEDAEEGVIRQWETSL